MANTTIGLDELSDYTPRNFEYFLQLGLTKFHVAKACRQQCFLDKEEMEAIKKLGLRKFNLGCKTYTMNINDGWLNIEKFANGIPGKFLKSKLFDDESESVFLNFNLRRGIPVENETLTFVYHSLLIDAFDYESALILFDDIYQSLMSGGKHRISTVDSKALLESCARRDSSSVSFNRDIYGDKFSIDRSDVYDEPGSLLSHLIFGYERQSLWDLDMLVSTLERAGFRNICHRERGDSEDAEIKRVENSYHQGRSEYCLYIECEK